MGYRVQYLALALRNQPTSQCIETFPAPLRLANLTVDIFFLQEKMEQLENSVEAMTRLPPYTEVEDSLKEEVSASIYICITMWNCCRTHEEFQIIGNSLKIPV